MEKTTLLYEGKAKCMYNTTDPDVLWVDYMDQATALNGKKKVHISEKGELNNHISSLIFKDLMEHGIETDFIQQISETEQLVKRVSIIPLETVVRNHASGSFERKFACEHLLAFNPPVQEFYYKSDPLDDPFINDSQAIALSIATEEEMTYMRTIALQVNERLSAIFAASKITLVDFKIEFGRTSDGKIILADEISPDSCRLVDQDTGESLDKDIFRKDLGDIIPVYQDVLTRLQQFETEAN